jgi:hypothetical protein
MASERNPKGGVMPSIDLRCQVIDANEALELGAFK